MDNYLRIGEITREMQNEFWKHNLNPITGLPDVSVRETSMPNEIFSIPKAGVNGFKMRKISV